MIAAQVFVQTVPAWISRAEDFLLDDLGADVFDLEQGRPVEGSAGQGTIGRRAAAAHDRLGIGESRLHQALDAADVGLVDERAHVGAGVHPVPDADVLKDGRQAGADLVRYPALHKDP